LLADSVAPILDIGCGVGLLAFYLRERGANQAITGLDIDERKIRRGTQVVEQHHYAAIDLRVNDVARELPAFSGSVVMFDVLHYLAPDIQQTLLANLAARVAPGASLLLRDSVRDGSSRYRFTYAAELFAQAIAWNWRAALHFPAAESIAASFPQPEFTQETIPAWGGTPFNNRLFIFRRRASEADSLTE
jgi:2-polyprenyl-3-methyl-5-hydroxy-6-metoxy-1,4-benzoquinol methylase